MIGTPTNVRLLNYYTKKLTKVVRETREEVLVASQGLVSSEDIRDMENLRDLCSEVELKLMTFRSKHKLI